MKIKRFNESIRDKMTGKSPKEVETALLKLTPYGMLDKIYYNGMEEFEDWAKERIEDSLEELDKIIEKSEGVKLDQLVTEVTKWVELNGGNSVNMTDYGIKELADHIEGYGYHNKRHDAPNVYQEEVFKSFIDLLKNYAMNEVKFNNQDWEEE